MKKKRFMKLLALASCVTLLTGCESEAFFGLGKYANKIADWGVGLLEKLGLKEASKKEEKQSEDQQGGGEQGGEQGGEEEQPKVPSMVVAELPEKLEVGEDLDLDEYVTLTNATEYEVVVAKDSEELAEVEGHVLTALDEGTIKFTVQSGELSQACSIDGFRASREALINYFDGVGNEYTVYDYWPNYTTEELELSDIVYHGKNYVLSALNWSSDQQGNPIPGGFLQFGENAEEAFMFTLDVDTEGNITNINVGKQYGIMYMEYLNSDFGVDFSEAEYYYDAQYDVDLYVIEGADAVNFAENSFFMFNGSVSDGTNDYYVKRVEFEIYDVAADGEEPEYQVTAYLYIDYDGEMEYLCQGTILVDDENVGIPELDAFCVPENKPEGVDYWNYFSDSLGLGDFFLSPDSYVGATGVQYVDYGWYNDKDEAIDVPESVIEYYNENYVIGYVYYLPVGTTTRFCSDTSFFDTQAVYDETTGDFLGYSPTSGKMLVEGEGENPDVVYNIFSTDTGYYAEEADEGVWEDDTTSLAGFRNQENYARGTIGEVTDVTEVNEQSGEEEYAYTLFEFQTGKFTPLLNTLINGFNELKVVGSLINFMASYSINLVNYMDATLVIDPYSGMAQFTFSFSWSNTERWEMSITSTYNPNAADQTASYEAYMLANVIEAA